MKNIFSFFTKKGNVKENSNFIGVTGKGRQTYMHKNILEELSKPENLNKHSFVIGKTNNGLRYPYTK
ncbi:hypothetical protein [Bacillus cereus]